MKDKTKEQDTNALEKLRQKLGGFEILETGLKLAEDKLRDSKVFTENLIASMKDGLFVLDYQGVHLDVNTALCQMTGFTREELIGTQLPHPYWPEESHEEMLTVFQKIMEGEFKDYELTFKRKNGERFPVIVSPSQIGNEEENAVRYFATVKDITERKQAEVALRESEEKFSVAFRSSPDIIAITTIKDGRYVDINDNYCLATGYSREELIGQRTRDIGIWARKEDRDRMFQILEKEGKISNEEFDFGIKSGEVHTWWFSAEKIIVGGEDCLIGVAIDITEEKKRQQLQHGENYVLRLLEQAVELPEVLDAIARLGEEYAPGIKASVMLVDSSHQLLKLAAAPSMPEEFSKVLENGLPIGPNIGTCGTAAYLKERVIVPDVTNSPLFASSEDLVRMSLLASFSQPIISSKGTVLGTIANYSNKVGEPSADTLRILEWSARVAAIAIEGKQAETALRESEARYRTLIETALEGVCIANEEETIIFANRAFAEMLGYKTEEVIGQNLRMLVSDEDWLKIRAEAEKRRRGESSQYEVTLLGKEGIARSVIVSGAPFLGPDSRFLGSLGVIMDITERKQAEEELRIAEQNFRNSLENSPLGVRIVSTKGELLYANQAILDIYGYSSVEELKTVPTKQRYTPESYAEHQARKEKRKLGKPVPPNYEVSIRRKDAEIRHLMVSRKPVVWDGEVQFQVIYQDITERKQAEEVYRTLANSSPVGVYIFQDGKYCFVNPEFQKLTGYSEDELLNMSPWQLVHPEDRAKARENAVRMLKGNLITPYEFRVIHGGGETHWAMETVSSIHYRGKRATLGNFMDITERKKLQEQLMLTDRLASIGQLASGIAHELNNPLTSVIGFSELLLERDLPADIREDLGTINREANRTAQVVRGLLTFARKQGGEKALVDINDAIQGVLQLRSYEQKVRNIEVKTALAPDLPKVMGNVSQLEQVFVNIIINAEQAMLEVRDRGRLTITTERVGDIVRASFTDDGPGISPENMGRIFTPFFTTKEVGKGSGLGLAICHGVVTEDGGKIYANSDLGKGATFIVELPIKQVIKRRRRKIWKT
ncbi:MAG: PAS domain S-box protein [Dehalococcoidia bacterium]